MHGVSWRIQKSGLFPYILYRRLFMLRIQELRWMSLHIRNGMVSSFVIGLVTSEFAGEENLRWLMDGLANWQLKKILSNSRRSGHFRLNVWTISINDIGYDFPNWCRMICILKYRIFISIHGDSLFVEGYEKNLLWDFFWLPVRRGCPLCLVIWKPWSCYLLTDSSILQLDIFKLQPTQNV